MQVDEGAGKLNRAVRSHVDKMRRRAAGKLLVKAVVAIELVIVGIEAHALKFFLEL